MKTKTFTLCTFIIALLALAACKKNAGEAPGEAKDLILTPLETQKVSADNAFTFKLLKTVNASAIADKNLMLSPLSVSMALGMTSNGSNGTTLQAIRNTMEFKEFTEAQVNSYYNHLINALPELDPLAKLKIANSIWYRNTFSVAAPFLQTNANYYKAAVEGLDFSNPSATTKINNWVNEQTNGKISGIIDEISNDDIMFLINAVYFKSNWQQKFDKSQTAKETFYAGNGSSVQADFMKANINFNRTGNAGADVYELPYGNGKYSMVIVMPQTKSVNDLVATLDTTKWKALTKGLTQVKQDIRMPKFKFAYDVELSNPLKTLGMGVAFSTNADFTRINSNGGLAITKVKHKTFVEVDEDGTEAAAVTSVSVSLTSVAPSVTINKPFLFAIREMKTGLILFTGIVNNPLLTE